MAQRRRGRGNIGRKAMRGFTLAELLVVLAVLGVLAGSLNPALAPAREAARRLASIPGYGAVAEDVMVHVSAIGNFATGVEKELRAAVTGNRRDDARIEALAREAEKLGAALDGSMAALRLVSCPGDHPEGACPATVARRLDRRVKAVGQLSARLADLEAADPAGDRRLH